MRGMIYAVSPEGVIGVGNRIPWRYQGDFRRFKRVTMGKTLIMGRKTFESIGHPLAGRRNIVVTSHPIAVENVESVRSIDEALERAGDEIDVWFIGGARIYAEAMKHVDIIDVTYVPDHVRAADAVMAPRIDGTWEGSRIVRHEDDPALKHRTFTRRASL
ncbi:MAG: dihydrofolate reductase [Polyangiaceae bacterium]|jgi:dihydrofolate reductase